MSDEIEDEFQEVADVLRGAPPSTGKIARLVEVLGIGLGRPVVCVTLGSVNWVSAPGAPGVEVATMTAWVRGLPHTDDGDAMDALIEQTVAEFGPWRWSQFTERALLVGGLPKGRARRIAALADVGFLSGPVVAGVGYFDQEAATRVLAAIPRERWDRLGERWGRSEVWTIAVEASSHRVAVFVHTEGQRAELQDTPRWREWERQLRTLIAEADEFASTRMVPVTIALDSCESFEANFQGNWSYYWW